MKVRAFVIIVSAGLCGCTVMPTVLYKKVNGPQDALGMSDSYFLQKSKLEISLVEAPEPVLTLKSTPMEDSSRKLAINPQSDWTSTTTISLAKFANTDLVSSIGVEVTNDVVKNITEVGSVIVKALPLIAMLAASEDTFKPCLNPKGMPVTLSLDLKSTGRAADETAAQGNASNPEKDCIKIRVEGLPPDALAYDILSAPLPTDSFLYSACRTVSVTVLHRGERLTISARVSDPRYFQSVRFPPKGTLTMHSQCGVSITSEKAANQVDASAVIQALAAQGKAIKDAIDAAKK